MLRVTGRVWKFGHVAEQANEEATRLQMLGKATKIETAPHTKLMLCCASEKENKIPRCQTRRERQAKAQIPGGGLGDTGWELSSSRKARELPCVLPPSQRDGVEVTEHIGVSAARDSLASG